MLKYPEINPVILHITDQLQIRWYGVMYLIGFLCCWLLLRHKTKSFPGWETADRVSDLIFYNALGVILGGRLGYILFYALPGWLKDPSVLFRIWEGGMSFHGGLIGVLVATSLFARRYGYPLLMIGDLMSACVPLALGLGRLGNFINGELWGRVTDVPWAMVFPHAGPLPRHPSQLYAVLLEGVLLFSILMWYAKTPRKIGSVTGLFLILYGLIRIFEEFFRQPDPQYGYLAWGWLTMGQILCVPMIVIGSILLARSRKAKLIEQIV